MCAAVSKVDIVVVGGGAAGLMCAISASQRGRSVVILEGSNKIGKKILMSGGGRCNFSNLSSDPGSFLSSNPHFCKSALNQYTQWDFIALVEKHGIAYHEKALGQLFCDISSKEIVAMLAKECESAGVTILTDCDCKVVPADPGYLVSCGAGSFSCESLVIASGGLSIPKMGASDFGYRLARQFGLPIVETRAGLVPFTFTGHLQELMARLSGVSCRAALVTNKLSFVEDILFTHRGLSGPAALQASSYWRPGDELTIDFFPDADATQLLMAAKTGQPRSMLRTALSRVLPRALIAQLQETLWPTLANTPLGEISDRDIRELATLLHQWTIKPAATEGYRTAEVTLGGVDTSALSSQTLECRTHRGLFFVGEVVDVSGHLGGYNFQWAWSSGWVAGQNA